MKPIIVDLSQPAPHCFDDWVEDWQRVTEPISPELIDWMRGRPDCLRDLMVRFPPNCVVRATRPLHIPLPGTCGVVSSYFEGGGVSVSQGPDDDIRAACESDWLEVVGYWNGLTPERVREILGGDAMTDYPVHQDVAEHPCEGTLDLPEGQHRCGKPSVEEYDGEWFCAEHLERYQRMDFLSSQGWED